MFFLYVILLVLSSYLVNKKVLSVEQLNEAVIASLENPRNCYGVSTWESYNNISSVIASAMSVLDKVKDKKSS